MVGKFLTKEQFIIKANHAHCNKYDYSIMEYTGVINKINIMCPKHGRFSQKAGNHLDGRGCPKCSKEKLEPIVSNWFYKKASKE